MGGCQNYGPFTLILTTTHMLGLRIEGLGHRVEAWLRVWHLGSMLKSFETGSEYLGSILGLAVVLKHPHQLQSMSGAHAKVPKFCSIACSRAFGKRVQELGA